MYCSPWAPIGIFPGKGRGYTGHGCAECETIMGIWGEPQRGPGTELLVRGSGSEALPEAESFEAFARLKEDPKLFCQYAKTISINGSQ